MPDVGDPKELQRLVHTGVKRLHNFRQARLMFIRSFTGQYYDTDHGNVGEEPINMVFNAIRSIVPQIVMNDPRHKIRVERADLRDYAFLMEKELDLNARQLKLRDVYRRWIVDALFTMGILKTGLAGSDTAVHFSDDNTLDPGELYTDVVDFDNFVFDPRHRGPIHTASFVGDRIRCPREQLLESGLYDNKLIEQLPKIDHHGRRDSVEDLSKRNVRSDEYDIQDEVEIFELYVPAANAIVTVPGGEHVLTEDYLRVEDYYGPDTGPYTFLSFTPPAPHNPVPVSYVGVWYDLHNASNRMMKKVIDQALRQKDIVGYRGQAADDAQEALDASDGEAVQMEDPNGINVVSFGGQQRSNEIIVDRLNQWYNMMAANPQGVAGQRMDAKSATEAQILSQNVSVGIEDMRDMVYHAAAEEARKRAFYLHTDPLKETPLTVRRPQPTPMGPVAVEQEVRLTPEARRGEWIDFNISIEPESMSRIDSETRLRRTMEFATQVIPAAAQAAQVAQQLGEPFSFMAYVTKMAEKMGIDWLDEVMHSPQALQQTMMQQQMSPGLEASTGGPAPGPGPRDTLSEMQHNGRAGRPTLREEHEPRRQQMGAAEMQRENQMNERY